MVRMRFGFKWEGEFIVHFDLIVPACANDENEVRFETVGVPYCGVPFFVAGLKILQCQSYRVRGGRKKKEIKIEVCECMLFVKQQIYS